MQYQWKHGSQVKIDAEVAGAELARISKELPLTTAQVVIAATPENAPLHPAFEWDDANAARLYRMEQARYLLRSLEIVVTNKTGSPVPVRAYVSVVQQVDDVMEKVYVTVQAALAEPESRAYIYQEALRQLEAWRRKYQSYQEMEAIIKATDSIVAMLQEALV